jgi:hypothetical protein
MSLSNVSWRIVTALRTPTHNTNHRQDDRKWVIRERREGNVDNAGLLHDGMDSLQVIFPAHFSLSMDSISPFLRVFERGGRHGFVIMQLKILGTPS